MVLIKYCECGCGQEVKNRFVHGHHVRVDNPSHRKNVNEKQKRSNIKTWNGDKIRKKHSEIMKEIRNRPNVKKGMIENNPMNKLEYRIKSGKAISRYWKNNPEAAKKMGNRVSIALKNKWKNDFEFVRYMKKCCAIKPNKSELKLFEIIKSIDSNFQYTGDFSFFIDGKNPDFTNHKDKKLIELFGNYWHGVKEEVPRLNHFYDNGWECIVIWENEMNAVDFVRQRVEDFVCME